MVWTMLVARWESRELGSVQRLDITRGATNLQSKPECVEEHRRPESVLALPTKGCIERIPTMPECNATFCLLF